MVTAITGRQTRPSSLVSGLHMARVWAVDASSLKDSRNVGEAEAIQRHLLRGEHLMWCDQGYAWAEQDAVGWFYVAAFVFVVLPYVLMKIRALAKVASWIDASREDALKRQVDSHPN
jgi:hypothetical protein